MIEEFTECLEEATDDAVEALRVRLFRGCALFGRTLGLILTSSISTDWSGLGVAMGDISVSSDWLSDSWSDSRRGVCPEGILTVRIFASPAPISVRFCETVSDSTGFSGSISVFSGSGESDRIAESPV